MNRPSRLTLVVNSIMLVAGSASGRSTTKLSPAKTVFIRLYSHAQVTPEVLRSATDEVSRLFQAARIHINWECLATESPQDQGTDMTSHVFQHPDARGYIVVRLMRRTPGNIFPGALGYSLPFAHKGAHVLIFYDRVEALANGVPEPTYIVSGHAMAHEIGHVLLGSSEHTSGGLMQARWTSDSWRLASAGLLSFTRKESEIMAARLPRFQAQQILELQPPILASSPLWQSKSFSDRPPSQHEFGPAATPGRSECGCQPDFQSCRH